MSSTVKSSSSSSAPSRSKPPAPKSAASKPAASKPATARPATAQPAPSASTARSAAPTRTAAAAAPQATPARDQVARSTPDKGSTPQTAQSAATVTRGLEQNFGKIAATPAAAPAGVAPAGAAPLATAAPAAAAPPAAAPGGSHTPPAQSLEIDMQRHTQARLDHTAARLNDPATSGADRRQLLREQASLRAEQRNLPPTPTVPDQLTPEARNSRRESGVPESLESHPGGPPQAPFTGRLERDENGRIRTGTLRNDASTDRHHYVTVNALPEGLTPEQARRTFERFNAPTNDALRGIGNDRSKDRGYVDPTGPVDHLLPRAGEPVGPIGRYLTQSGGHVELRHGETANGRPYAINTTIPGEHPLMGHVTRTLVNEDGRYYIRTEGVGAGNDGRLGARHLFNQVVGPATFNNLDTIAGEYAERLRAGHR